MTALPLLPAAIVAIVLSLLATVGPGLVSVVAAAVSIASAALAVASADRMRRLAWAAAGLIAVVAALRLVLPATPVTGIGALADLRAALGEPLRRLVPEPESGILLGVALGDRGSISADLAYAFARSGTSHLLAISGFNMTLVAAAVGALLRGRIGPRGRAAATVAAVILYSLLVGLGASVVRSAVMAAITSLGLALGRRAAAQWPLRRDRGDARAGSGDPRRRELPAERRRHGRTARVPGADRRALRWLPSLAGDGLAATLAATCRRCRSSPASSAASRSCRRWRTSSRCRCSRRSWPRASPRSWPARSRPIWRGHSPSPHTRSRSPCGSSSRRRPPCRSPRSTCQPGPLTALLFVAGAAAVVIAARRVRVPLPHLQLPGRRGHRRERSR